MEELIIECSECDSPLDECKCAMCPHDGCPTPIAEPKLDMCKLCGYCTIYAHCKCASNSIHAQSPVIANKQIKTDDFGCAICDLPLADESAGPVVFTGLAFICSNCAKDTGDPDPTPPMHSTSRDKYPIPEGDMELAFLKRSAQKEKTH